MALIPPVDGQVRAAAQVDEIAAAEERDGLALGDVRQALDLEALACVPGSGVPLRRAETSTRSKGVVLGDDLPHLLLDPRKVLGG